MSSKVRLEHQEIFIQDQRNVIKKALNQGIEQGLEQGKLERGDFSLVKFKPSEFEWGKFRQCGFKSGGFKWGSG